jgi:type IV secretory pathway VirB9-like protein
MRRSMAFLLLLGIWGCSHEEPLPPVPNAPEDLSTWAVPELVQPPPPQEPVPIVPKEKPTSAELVQRFTPGTTFIVNVQVGVPLDVVLDPGEEVRNLVGGSGEDTTAEGAPAEPTPISPWTVKEGVSGKDATLRHHVFLTVTKPKLTMGLVITTTQRVLYLTCKSVKTSPIRAVRWEPSVMPADIPVKPKEPGLLPDPTEPKLYHVGYELHSSHPNLEFLPRQVVDNGKKVFIIYPEVSLFERVPVLRLVGPNGPMLTNARQYLNVLIVDELVARAELRFGVGEHAQVITITRGNLRTIQCGAIQDADPDCPVWPVAASKLAR